MSNQYEGWSAEERLEFATQIGLDVIDELIGRVAFIRDNFPRFMAVIGVRPGFFDLIFANPAYDKIMDAKKAIGPGGQILYGFRSSEDFCGCFRIIVACSKA